MRKFVAGMVTMYVALIAASEIIRWAEECEKDALLKADVESISFD